MNLSQAPSQDPRLKTLLEALLALEPEAYLVGGAVRDHVMGLPDGIDLDVAVAGDGFLIAGRLVDTMGLKATFVPLDRGLGTARIVLHGEEPTTVDVAGFKGSSIMEDLGNRDFTMNAMAVRVPDYLNHGLESILDPTGGRADIASGLVRTCSSRSFEDDPLRILRAFRFSAAFGFDISEETLEQIPRFLPRLTGVSPERIRDELLATLACPKSFDALAAMDRCGVIGMIMPELEPMKGCVQNYYHHLDVWNHTLETYRGLEEIVLSRCDCFGDHAGKVLAYLSEEPVKGRPRSALLKLATIFHDAGKPATRTVQPEGRVRFFGHEKLSRQIFEETGERLKLAKRETSVIAEWIGGHMRPAMLTGQGVSRRAMYRLYRTFGTDLMGLLLLFLADLAATRGPARESCDDEDARAAVRHALDRFAEFDETRRAPILTGWDLINIFGMESGPYLGSVVKRLAELQGSGEISSREQAIVAVRKMMEEDGEKAAGR